MLSDQVRKTIEEQIKKDKVVIYMKGSADFPQCGFSARVVDVIRNHGKPFKTYDVLQDMALREGIKEFTNWPTIPQVYVNGEFVGGCDIIMDLERKGELAKLIS